MVKNAVFPFNWLTAKVKAVSQTKNGLPVTNPQGPWEIDAREGKE